MGERVCKIICFSVYVFLLLLLFKHLHFGSVITMAFRPKNSCVEYSNCREVNKTKTVFLSHTVKTFFLGILYNLSRIVVLNIVVVCNVAYHRNLWKSFQHKSTSSFLLCVFWRRTIQSEIYCWIRNELVCHYNIEAFLNPIF